MKVKLKEAQEPKEKEQKYPYLGIGNVTSSIVLFTARNSGIVVKSDKHEVCFDKKYFDESFFPPYKGKVILSND